MIFMVLVLRYDFLTFFVFKLSGNFNRDCRQKIKKTPTGAMVQHSVNGACEYEPGPGLVNMSFRYLGKGLLLFDLLRKVPGYF